MGGGPPRPPTLTPPPTPPPPPAPLPPPSRTDRAVQDAESTARAGLRRRGRRRTLLTAGQAAGVTQSLTPTRKVLLGQ